MDFNELTLTGRLGKDPETKELSGGVLVCEFSVASGYVAKGEKKTEWTTCKAWNKTAEIAAQYLRKGSRVLVSGRKQTREWTDNTGAKRYAVDLMVNSLVLLDPAPGAAQPAATQASRPAPAARTPVSRPPAHAPATAAKNFDDDIPF